MHNLLITDHNQVTAISYDDLVKYHGRLFIGGVAMAYKAMQLAFRLLANDGGILAREEISFRSAMGPEARGLIDAVEMATRSLSRGALTASTALPARIPAPSSPNGGKYYFEFHYGGVVLAMSVKEGLIAPEFIAYSRKELAGAIQSGEEAHLQEVKEELAAALLAAEPENLFDWELVPDKHCTAVRQPSDYHLKEENLSMKPFIVSDRNDILEISYEDMIKYHGRHYIGGVAIAYKVLELAFDRLLGGQIPAREKIRFASAMGLSGMGLLDGVEMVTRAWTRGRFTADHDLPCRIPAPSLPRTGKYYYELSYEGQTIAMALKEGLIPEEFMVLSRKAGEQTINESEAVRLQKVKEELAAALMGSEAASLFNYIIVSD